MINDQPAITCDLIISKFNQCFKESHNTILVGGSDEPLYLPSTSSDQPHQIFFRQDFIASALHEISHWCIASKSRHKLIDFGYNYKPNRTPEEQEQFLRFEARPQALESIFHDELKTNLFSISLDGIEYQSKTKWLIKFESFINHEIKNFNQNGLPKKAMHFIDYLQKKEPLTLSKEVLN